LDPIRPDVSSHPPEAPCHRPTSAAQSPEVWTAVVFLMSNGFMNGEILNIDSGARLG
jgi:hypothetical protein